MEKLTPAEKIIVERLGHIRANVNALTVFTKSTHKEVKTIEKTTDVSSSLREQNALQFWLLGGVWLVSIVNLAISIYTLVR